MMKYSKQSSGLKFFSIKMLLVLLLVHTSMYILI